MQATLSTHRDDEDGSWLIMPTPERAISHATPFPEFDRDGEWQVGRAVHDFALAQMQRFIDAEREEAEQ